MNSIFISYRREDSSGFARSLFQSLEAHFGSGQVFMDVEGIELGLDFVEALDKCLANCGVLLVLIGKDWANCTNENGIRRLADPRDFVRMEVASALQRSDVRVIPVLVRGANMPKTSELPEDLKPLTRRQALELRHDRWNADVLELIEALENVLGIAAKKAALPSQAQAQQVKPPTPPIAKAGNWMQKALAITGGIFVVLIILSLFFYEDNETVSETPSIASLPPSTTLSTRPSTGIPAISADLIFQTQQVLTELGYQPGPVDGVSGSQTTQAVMAFQRNRGLPVDGQITAQLLEAMNQALMTREPRTPASRAVNMTGTWRDDLGLRYTIVQQGNAMQFQAYDLYGTLVGGGEGMLNDRQVEYVFIAQDGSQGAGRGTISQDGRRMQYTLIDLLTGEQETGWVHKE